MAGSAVRKTVAISFVIILSLTCMAGFLCDESSAEGKITVKDGIGREVVFDSPVDHIITSGTGATATVIQLGCLDKISVCDNYTKNNGNVLFDGLRSKISDGKVLADGNCYKSGRGAYISDIVTVADTSKGGTFDRTRDAVVLTASKTYVDAVLSDYREKQGKELTDDFSKVLIWYDNEIDSYSKIIDFCSVISQVLTGTVSDTVKSMYLVSEKISSTLAEKGVTQDMKVSSFYIKTSTTTWMVGNKGSIATSMIEAAGGNVITIDEGKASTYPMTVSELTDFRETHPGRWVMFVDSNMPDGEIDALLGCTNSPGNESTAVVMDSLWNNYDIACKDGVWTMACAMYPDYFQGDVPVYGVSESNNPLTYFLAALVVVGILMGITYWLTARRG